MAATWRARAMVHQRIGRALTTVFESRSTASRSFFSTAVEEILYCSRRSLSTTAGKQRDDLQVCIVGSGPAGFYTADKVLKRFEGARVDILDRLPTPFGLVRSGVAPDHPETKNVINKFSQVAVSDRCSYYGNVTLGADVSLGELRELYDVVVLAYGAESDRRLGVTGEDLIGVHAAREFVWWYNGHPDQVNLQPDLQSSDTAVILGQGNVALDCARILLRSTEELTTTDIAEHALTQLRESRIRRVLLVGRRGPVQAACTAKELREIMGIKGLSVNVHASDLGTSPADLDEMKVSRKNKRVYELFVKAAGLQPSTNHDTGSREISFVFFRNPAEILSSSDGARVAGVKLEKTVLQGGKGKLQRAVGTGEFEDVSCGLVLKSIGYKSIPVLGLPFDHRQGLVPNSKGRVLSYLEQGSSVETGLFVAGWLKRGPTGIIGDNVIDADDTVQSIVEEWTTGNLGAQSNSCPPGSQGLQALLQTSKGSGKPAQLQYVEVGAKDDSALFSRFCSECVMSSLPTGCQGQCAVCGTAVTATQLVTIPPNPTRSVALVPLLLDPTTTAPAAAASAATSSSSPSPSCSTTDSDDPAVVPIKGVQMKSKLKALLADLAKVRKEHDGAKVLIFSQFMQTIAWLKAEFKKKGINYRFISGDMPMKKRAQAIEAFQKDPPTTVFLLSIRTGAVGITLTAASHVYMLEPCLNPALEEQAVGRCWRMGQERPVVIKRLYVENSVEANILKLLRSRMSAANISGSQDVDSSTRSTKSGKNGIGDVAGCIRTDKQNLRLNEFEILFS